VEKGGRGGWLVGSLHLLTADAYPLPAALDAAFATADVLVEEANPEELKAPAAAMQLVAKAMYPAGTTLQSQVSKDTFDRIASRAAKIGLPIERLQGFKPWMVALTLVGWNCRRAASTRAWPDPALSSQPARLLPARRCRTLETHSSRIDFSKPQSAAAGEASVGGVARRGPTPSCSRFSASSEPAVKAATRRQIERLLLTDMKELSDCRRSTRRCWWGATAGGCAADRGLSCRSSACFVVGRRRHPVGPEGPLFAMSPGQGLHQSPAVRPS
jgi:hypothetical protein